MREKGRKEAWRTRFVSGLAYPPSVHVEHLPPRGDACRDEVGVLVSGKPGDICLVVDQRRADASDGSISVGNGVASKRR